MWLAATVLPQVKKRGRSAATLSRTLYPVKKLRAVSIGVPSSSPPWLRQRVTDACEFDGDMASLGLHAIPRVEIPKTQRKE